MQHYEGKGTWNAFPWEEGTVTMSLGCASKRLQVKGGQRNWK